ncbi:signal peptidase I [Candidatus Saganbacteria bacterium]|nr:signal peptidase I [Candidatus Saganbacteria bacterium]
MPTFDAFKKWLREWAETLIVAFLMAIVIRAFFIQVFWIPSGSMEPTLNINDRIIVNKLAYGVQNPLFESFKERSFLYIIPNPLFSRPIFLSDKQYFLDFHRGPKRFDIVVFKLYDRELNRKDLIKRVIGMPGEKWEIKQGIVYINDKPLKETHQMFNDYYDLKTMPATFGPKIIPNDSYFVMGDNRPNSADSRYWGFLPKSQLVGPAFLRIWPLWQFGLI